MAAGFITVYPDTPEAYSVELTEAGCFAIGRKPDPQGTTKLVLPHPEVSGQHAEIRRTLEGWTIRDSGSTNGTRLNGERLVPGREYLLQNGDRVKIAQIDLLVALPESVLRAETELEKTELEKTHFRIQLINATILVADIKGFTALMEAHADNPEVVMQATQRVFASLNEEISNNQGQLEKIMGDAIMAYWQEDVSKTPSNLHAYQACYTALRLRTLANALAANPDYWPFPEHPLRLDLALSTGPAAAGSLGHSEANPALLGDTANIAFRLEKLITDETPSRIIVDKTTHNLTEHKFKFIGLGKVNVAGRQRAVDAFCLIDCEESRG
ncbi:MAG: adenylate/guanylate cyclase domain-containing protein [Candidatus Melainabacteria bacterium]|nr:adenylate/guanylate cyclase domain-containing protein [Candidatus Melainabacteria bacterium]